MGTILLFYKYIQLDDPHHIMKWQKKIASDLGLRGRIFIAHEGINGTVGGSTTHIEQYKKLMREKPEFADIDFKESPGDAESFPRLHVTIKNEVVHLGIDPRELTPEKGGLHLNPDQVHELIKKQPDDLVILDARNMCEWKIGKFQNAITPNIDYFRQLPVFIDEHLDQFKDKQVLMYCTGGIRCERASAYLQSKNVAKQVYQILGGIHRYVEKYPDGFFRGKNYVFDGRIAVKVNDDVLGSCSLCKTPCDTYVNCLNAECNEHYICCPACADAFNNTCSSECKNLVLEKKVKMRPPFQKTHAEKPKSR